MEALEDEVLERQHFIRVLNTFKAYRNYSMRTWALMKRQYERLPDRHKRIISDHPAYLEKVKVCIEENYEVLEMVVEAAESMFENKKEMYRSSSEKEEPVVTGRLDVDKIYSTLKQVVREWGEHGRKEREQSYGVVIREILVLLGAHKRENVSILVPGVGLGRLAYDLAQLGFCCQGNEFSLFMLIMSNFIINRSLNSQQFLIYPWVHETTNCLSHSHQLRSSRFPDKISSHFHSSNQDTTDLSKSSSEHPTSAASKIEKSLSTQTNNHQPQCRSPTHSPIHSPTHSPIHSPTHSPIHSPTHSPIHSHAHSTDSTHYASQSPDNSPKPPSNNFSIVAGDFLQVYTTRASWDCVATVFFLDTSHNILSYIDTIFHILKPGAFWVNFGPLLYHFANTEDSLELSHEQVMRAVRMVGFQVLKEERGVECTYNHKPFSMLTQQYHCVLFVAQKPHSQTTP